jgi:ankyrin repeat protein
MVKLLLSNGAQTGLQDRTGNTALSLAKQQNNPDMIALLQQGDNAR